MPLSQFVAVFLLEEVTILLYTLLILFLKFTILFWIFLKMRPGPKVGPAMAEPTGPVPPGLAGYELSSGHILCVWFDLSRSARSGLVTSYPVVIFCVFDLYQPLGRAWLRAISVVIFCVFDLYQPLGRAWLRAIPVVIFCVFDLYQPLGRAWLRAIQWSYSVCLICPDPLGRAWLRAIQWSYSVCLICPDPLGRAWLRALWRNLHSTRRNEWLMARGEFARGEVLPSEKVTIHFYSWKIGLQNSWSIHSGRRAV